MTVKMHFATFLKLLTQNTGDKVRDLSKYGQSGGFDFYRSSRDGVTDVCVKGKSLDIVLSKVKILSPEYGVERNLDVVTHCHSWFSKQSGQPKEPGHGVWRSPNKIFSVLIEPEISFVSGQIEKIVAVYPRKEPRINRDQAGAGIIVLQKAYKKVGNEKFGILDAYAEKAFWSPTNASQSILDHEVAMIENELQKITA